MLPEFVHMFCKEWGLPLLEVKVPEDGVDEQQDINDAALRVWKQYQTLIVVTIRMQHRIGIAALQVRSSL